MPFFTFFRYRDIGEINPPRAGKKLKGKGKKVKERIGHTEISENTEIFNIFRCGLPKAQVTQD